MDMTKEEKALAVELLLSDLKYLKYKLTAREIIEINKVLMGVKERIDKNS